MVNNKTDTTRTGGVCGVHQVAWREAMSVSSHHEIHKVGVAVVLLEHLVHFLVILLRSDERLRVWRQSSHCNVERDLHIVDLGLDECVRHTVVVGGDLGHGCVSNVLDSQRLGLARLLQRCIDDCAGTIFFDQRTCA